MNYISSKNADRGGTFRAIRKGVYIGCFATAVEAAVAYARHVGPPQVEASTSSESVAPVVSYAEGLQLYLSPSNATGYQSVTKVGGRFSLVCKGVHLGMFATAVEAAVAYARHVGPPPQVAVSEAEGLKLHLSVKSSTGYRGVTLNGGRFHAKAGSKQIHLGCFATAVEAAVAYARYFGPSSITVDAEDVEVDDDGMDEAVEEEAGSSSAAVSSPAPSAPPIAVGSRVLARHLASGGRGETGTRWYPAIVLAVDADGTCDVEYEQNAAGTSAPSDRGREAGVEARYVRLMPPEIERQLSEKAMEVEKEATAADAPPAPAAGSRRASTRWRCRGGWTSTRRRAPARR